jgi:hypothetical protein
MEKNKMNKNAFDEFGYNIHTWKKDVFGKNHKFCVSPANGTTGGGVNYFENLHDVETFLYQIKYNRAIESEEYEKAERINIILYARKTGKDITDLFDVITGELKLPLDK